MPPLTAACWCRCARRFHGLAVSELEIGLLILCGLLGGGLIGAALELKRLHRETWQYWMSQAKAQDEVRRLRADLAEANRRIGALQATHGEVLEAAIGAAKLAQLDALHITPNACDPAPAVDHAPDRAGG